MARALELKATWITEPSSITTSIPRFHPPSNILIDDQRDHFLETLRFHSNEPFQAKNCTNLPQS